ncbi:MAG: DUF3772 domain-containing protein [Hyphomicrobiales bacterium]|nr:DUF3772 domain-containing protein [Hyphomicrobiales bacterium]
MNTRPAIWLAIAFAALVAWPAALAAQSVAESATNSAELTEFTEPLAGWESELERIENIVSRPGLDEGALTRFGVELEKLRATIAATSGKWRQSASSTKQQLDKLGPAPKPEEASEPEAAGKERKKLSALATQIDGAIRTADVLAVRANQLGERLHELRRSLFLRQLFDRTQSPLSAGLWQRASEDASVGWNALANFLGNWLKSVEDLPWVGVAIAAGIAVWASLKLVARRLIARFRPPVAEAPPYLRRAGSAVRVMVARAAPALAGAGIIYSLAWAFGMLRGRMDSLALAALLSFSLVVAVMVLVRTALAPRQPEWRILPASDAGAMRIWWLGGGLAVLYGLDLFLAELTRLLGMPLSLTIAQSVVTTGAFAVLLGATVSTRLVDGTSDDAGKLSPVWHLIRIVLWLLVLAILASAILGYVALARFLATQVVVTGSLLALFYLSHVAIEEYSAGLMTPETRIGRWAAAQSEWSEQRQERWALFISLLLHILLLLVAIPLLLLQWGFDWLYVRMWIGTLFTGVQLGSWRISVGTVLLALVVFVVGIIATRVFQRWLNVGFLERGKFNKGARGAVLTAVGYLGFTIAAIVAISFLGLDFSSIAIVAGALGVGIGFGLQSIVNNFVSGLILLAERRINVGDWIIVGGEEGFVRNINIRATEIETFDRNFVIIPNSELITQSVKNWMLRHRRARVLIEVGVAYDSDPEKVKEVMLECARQHPHVTDLHKTGVWFMNFGDSALIFRLKTFVSDIDHLLDVRSDLRYAIFAGFREAGIQIPFPQRDLHLKDIDRLERAIEGKPAPKPRRTPVKKRASTSAAG